MRKPCSKHTLKAQVANPFRCTQGLSLSSVFMWSYKGEIVTSLWLWLGKDSHYRYLCQDSTFEDLQQQQPEQVHTIPCAAIMRFLWWQPHINGPHGRLLAFLQPQQHSC